MESFSSFKTLQSLPGPVLVTGHTGFKGSWLMLVLKELGIETVGISLRPQNDSMYNLLSLENTITEEFIDIRIGSELKNVIRKHQPSLVIHLAAQSIVSEGYRSPFETFEVNVNGTLNLIQSCRENMKKFPQIFVATTDKVYQNLELGMPFKESDPLGGSDPYSSSKSMVELLLRGLRYNYSDAEKPLLFSARAGNVIGGGDLSKERLLPDLVRGIQSGQKVVIRNPESTRPWQHVLDALFGYLTYIEKGLTGVVPQALNFGPNTESLSVREVAEYSKKRLGDRLEVQYLESNTPMTEAKKLELDSSLAFSSIGWKPLWSQSQALERSISWWENFLSNEKTGLENSIQEIQEYMKDMEPQKL